MRFGHRVALGFACIAGLVMVAPRSASAYPPIEAEKGKQYKLTKKHGPWMIMVASFQEPAPELKGEGLSPGEAADELVFELRRKGIPAYKFAREDVVETLTANDRIGRQRSRSYVAQQGSVCVLAGNYSNADDDVSQKTLKYVKSFHPDFLKEVKASAKSKDESISLTVLKNGGVFRSTPGRKTPLAGAFLTLNPMLTPEEAAQRKDDPLILKLNGGSEYSLLRNSARYTLVVATFAGQSQTQVGRLRMEDAEKKFRADTLDTAGQNAFELCQALRQGKFNHESDTNKPPRYLPVKAWVFHDRYRSYVAVGEFDSPTDPKIKPLMEQFRAKQKQNPVTKTNYLAAERIMIPAQDPKKFPDRMWIFDPEPLVMPVPKTNL